MDRNGRNIKYTLEDNSKDKDKMENLFGSMVSKTEKLIEEK